MHMPLFSLLISIFKVLTYLPFFCYESHAISTAMNCFPAELEMHEVLSVSGLSGLGASVRDRMKCTGANGQKIEPGGKPGGRIILAREETDKSFSS